METDGRLKHSRSLHMERLHSLCRVCGGRSRKRTMDSSLKLCKHVVAELVLFHDIDILFDRNDTHSKTVCTKCYSRLKSFLSRSDIPSATTMRHAECLIDSAAHLWKEFDATQPEEECSVCSRFLRQTRGGRPARQKKGRPKRSEVLKASTASFDNLDTSALLPVPPAVCSPVKRPTTTDIQTLIMPPTDTVTAGKMCTVTPTSPIKQEPGNSAMLPLFRFLTTVLSPWNFSHRKSRLLSPENASCDRVALPNLRLVSVSIITEL